MALVAEPCAFDLICKSAALNHRELVLEVEVVGEGVLFQDIMYPLQNCWMIQFQDLLSNSSNKHVTSCPPGSTCSGQGGYVDQ